MSFLGLRGTSIPIVDFPFIGYTILIGAPLRARLKSGTKEFTFDTLTPVPSSNSKVSTTGLLIY